MILFTESQMRKVIRQEFERLMEAPQERANDYSIKSNTGGEIIMPNYIKEAFDSGKIKNIRDIL